MGITRQLIFGIDPYSSEQRISTLSFADVPDANTTSKAFTCGLVPHSRSSGVSLMQETMFLGTTSAVGKTFQALKDTLSMDGAMAVTATAVTQRIDPEARADDSGRNAPRDVTQKRFLNLNFSVTSPFRDGMSISYCLDGDPISGDPVTWKDFLGTEGDTKISFDGARGNFCNLRFVDTSVRYNEIAVPAFALNYVPEGAEREGGNL